MLYKLQTSAFERGLSRFTVLACRSPSGGVWSLRWISSSPISAIEAPKRWQLGEGDRAHFGNALRLLRLHFFFFFSSPYAPLFKMMASLRGFLAVFAPVIWSRP